MQLCTTLVLVEYTGDGHPWCDFKCFTCACMNMTCFEGDELLYFLFDQMDSEKFATIPNPNSNQIIICLPITHF